MTTKNEGMVTYHEYEERVGERKHGSEKAIQHVATDMISPQEIIRRRDAILQVMEGVMKPDVHYGHPYAGSEKKVLLKPGGEVLLVTFQLNASLERKTVDLGDGHREYIVTTTIRHSPTDTFLCHGMGSCSTMESKFRYRNIDEPTDIPVPKAAWDLKNEGKMKDMRQLLARKLKEAGVDVPAGAEVGFVKDNNQWVVSIKGKAENPDIADTYNTCLKMACKRSLLHGVITATGASDLFTHDVEEFPDYNPTPPEPTPPPEKKKEQPKREAKPPKAPPTPPSGGEDDMAEFDHHMSRINRLVESNEYIPKQRIKKMQKYLSQNINKLDIAGLKKIADGLEALETTYGTMKRAEGLGIKPGDDIKKFVDNTINAEQLNEVNKSIIDMIDNPA